MKCPIDAVDLVMTERSGIEIDYCPKCRGVWLDRGELDKIIERSVGEGSASGPAASPEPRYEDRSRYQDEHGRSGSRGKHRRGGFLGQIFDF